MQRAVPFSPPLDPEATASAFLSLAERVPFLLRERGAGVRTSSLCSDGEMTNLARDFPTPPPK